MDTRARLAIFAIVEQNHGVKENRCQAESMRRMTHEIPFVPIKDHTVVGTSDKIERMPIT